MQLVVIVQGGQRILFVDSCSGHVKNKKVIQQLDKITTELHMLPANAIHLFQPAESFVIQKIKDACRRPLDRYKAECVKTGMWRSSSRMLPNPGKNVFCNWQ